VTYETPDWAKGLTASTSAANPTPKPPADFTEDDESSDSFEPLTIEGVVFPRIASQRIRNFSEIERKKWDADRFKCLTDQLCLSSVLGMDLQENPHRALFALFPKKQPGVDFSQLDTVTKKRMILWPRGLGKTSAIRVEMVQTILNYPNVRMCFLTGNDQIAKRQLAALKNCFEKPTERFKYLFPEFVFTSHQNRKTHEWTDAQDEMSNQHEFVVPCRTNFNFAEPTFCISTSNSVKAGTHFDFMFVDDLVHELNWQKATALDKCFDSYLALLPILDPRGYIYVTGTRYSWGDAYERIQEQAQTAGESTVWKFSIRDCWSTGCKNCKHPDVFHDRNVNILEPPCTADGCACKGFVSDGVRGVLFPQVQLSDGRLFGHTVEFLNQQLAEMGETKFANQYLNNPIAASTQTFTETMIGAQTIHDIKMLPAYGAAFTFLVGDLAYSEADDRDLSVIYTVLKYQGNLFVTDCAFGHWSANQLVEITIKLILAKRPNIVYFERPAGPADALNNLLVARAAQVGLPKIPIEWVKVLNQKGAKATRIGNIQASLMSKRLWLYAGMPGYDQLVQQLCRWPRLKHDDFADALARVIEAPSGWQFDTPSPIQSPTNWLRKFNQAAPVDDGYPDSGGGSGMACGG
jgi:predicted phage terminase large subunit-like protein